MANPPSSIPRATAKPFRPGTHYWRAIVTGDYRPGQMRRSNEFRELKACAICRQLNPELLLKYHAHIEAMIQEEEKEVPTDE